MVKIVFLCSIEGSLEPAIMSENFDGKAFYMLFVGR